MVLKKSALIIGCGYVGQQLQALLESKNWDVWSARRTPTQDTKALVIDVGVEFSLTRKFDVVFYMVSAGAYTPHAYQIAYVKGVENTLRAVKSSNSISRFIFVSSTSVFLENNGGWVDENSPIESNTFGKASLLQGENLVSLSGLDYSIVRMSGIYGPGRTPLIDSIRLGNVKLKRAPFISNRIHVKDSAGILEHLAILQNPDPLYIGTDCEPVAYNEVVHWLSNQLEFRFLEFESQEQSEKSLSIHMSNKKCSNTKIIQSGYTFHYPTYKEGLLSCL